MVSESQDYQHEMTVALALAREAGATILDYYEGPLHIEQKKGANDWEPVTQADKAANELIVDRLRREFPHDGILAEESEDTQTRLSKRRVWMVDPLDGTTGFIDGNGDFAVQIGLTVDGQSVLGVVYQPQTDVVYRAVRGQGTVIERPEAEPAPGRVTTETHISRMRLAASRSHRSPRMDKVVQTFGLREEVRRGSVGIKIGLLVEEQCDLYIHLSPRTKQWDTCAPEIILTEAGGRISDLFGRPLRYNQPELQNKNGVVATNGVAHEKIVAGLKPLLEQFGRVPVA